MKKYVSPEMVARARQMDLLTYLRLYEPEELVKIAPDVYSTRTHDSLKISHGKWCWNSRGIGGRSALDYLIKVRGMAFQEAVQALCGPCFSPGISAPVTEKKRSFRLPEANLCPNAVVSYLRGRGIDMDIVGVCLALGILSESRKYRNCVFIGRDKTGVARFACLRGTHDNFKQDAPGSDKRFGFCLPARDADCPRLAVAESPIDALSLATLVKRYGGDWRDSNYLSLGGTAPRALLQYLRDHPQIKEISLCLDNDRAGLDGAERIEQATRNCPGGSG